MTKNVKLGKNQVVLPVNNLFTDKKKIRRKIKITSIVLKLKVDFNCLQRCLVRKDKTHNI